MGKEKKDIGIGFKIIDAIKKRMKEEARDLDCLKVLKQKNPELAKLLSDIDDIIVNVSYQELCKSFQKAMVK